VAQADKRPAGFRLRSKTRPLFDARPPPVNSTPAQRPTPIPLPRPYRQSHRRSRRGPCHSSCRCRRPAPRTGQRRWRCQPTPKPMPVPLANIPLAGTIMVISSRLASARRRTRRTARQYAALGAGPHGDEQRPFQRGQRCCGCAPRERRRGRKRPWTSLAAPGPGHKVRGSLVHTDWQHEGACFRGGGIGGAA